MKFSEHIQITRKAIKLLLLLSRSYTVCSVLYSFISAILPYVPIYFSARLIDALYAGAALPTLVLHASLTVGIVFLLSLLNTYISARRSVAASELYRGQDWKYSEKAMQMAYESIENRDVALLRERTKKETQTGFNLYYFHHCTENIIKNITQVVASVSLTISFFFIEGIPLFMKLAFVTGVILTLVCGILTSKKQGKLDNDFFESSLNMNIIFSKYYEYLEHYSSGKDIRLYDMADDLASYGADTNREYYNRNIQNNMKKSAANLLDNMMNYLLRFGTYMILIYAALPGNITVGSIARYISCIMLMLSAVSGLMKDIHTMLHNNKYLQRYFSYFDIPNNMYQGSLTVEKRDDNEYFVEFRDVSFKYPNSDIYALRHVSLKFRIGEKLAVVGMNGSGKTTFIKLMCRLYDPTEGEILLNGVNIKKYDYDEYMSIFSVVFQDFGLFSFSLGQNVAANSDYDPEKVKRCLEHAGFGERLATMPDGVRTCLYKDFDKAGVEISGGEAQKIALARALYKDAPFIILDEPTAALDPVAEYEIYSAFNEIVGDKTAIYISHRLSSCRFCDNIAVFDNGQIVQRGTHEQLLTDTDGKYHELWHAQSQYYTDK